MVSQDFGKYSMTKSHILIVSKSCYNLIIQHVGWNWKDSWSNVLVKLKSIHVAISSVQFSCSVMSNSLWPQGLQHARPPCPSPSPRVYSSSSPLSRWCHPNISSSAVPFSSCLQSFPASGSFPMSQLFISGGQSIRVSTSATVLPMNIQDWFSLGWTGWISMLL